MKPDMIEKYADRVYAYAVKRTFSEEEAADLSQEILYTAIREMTRLKLDDSFEAWLWGIAANVTKAFRRRMGKMRAIYSYDMPDLPYEDEYFVHEEDEAYAALRTKIAMLAAKYRDVIVLHYYDGLSTKQISERLNIPEGTVTWRLSEARRKLKKECDHMDTTALRPQKMKIDIYGTGNYNGKTVPFPSAYINDALSQNILYYCYEEAYSIEELSKFCGVPAYYIEDRVDNLLNRRALLEQTKGKYRTDFIIWSDKYGIYCEENAEKLLTPIMDKLTDALENIAANAGKIDFYKAEKPERDLFYLYGILAFEYIRNKYVSVKYPEIEENYDGNRWRYVASMESGEHPRLGLAIQRCLNQGSRGTFAHTVYGGIDGFSWRQMMYDNYINACEDILSSGNSEDKVSVSDAVSAGYIERCDDGTFRVTCPAFYIEQKMKFDVIVEKYLAPVIGEYASVVDRFTAGYKKIFPKHLSDDADRMCHAKFLGMLNYYFRYAQRTGVIEMPSEGSFCDVLVQFE